MREIFFGKSATLFVLCREQAWDEDGPKIDNVAQRLNYRVISYLFNHFSLICEYIVDSGYSYCKLFSYHCEIGELVVLVV